MNAYRSRKHPSAKVIDGVLIPDKDFDLERDIAEGTFERANLMSIARGDGPIIAGIVTDSAGNIFVGGDRSHPDFQTSLINVVREWIDAKGEDIGDILLDENGIPLDDEEVSK